MSCARRSPTGSGSRSTSRRSPTRTTRAEIVRRREAFAPRPRSLPAPSWAAAQHEAGRPGRAPPRALPPAWSRLADALYGAVGQLVVSSGVDSHRADITIVECAKAIAALAGRDEADAEDVLAAAELALGHRLAADPFAPAAPSRAAPPPPRARRGARSRGEPKKSRGPGDVGARARRRRPRSRRRSSSMRVDPAAVFAGRRRLDRARAGAARTAGALVRRPAAGQVHAPPAGSAGRHRHRARRDASGRPRCAAGRAPAGRPAVRTSAAGSASIARRSASASSSTTAGRFTPSGWSRR